jgi:outer membrane protein assembly factor BamB
MMGYISMKNSIRRPLRVWPAVVIVILQWAIRLGIPVLSPDNVILGILSGMVAAILILLWWLFLSRAAWLERLGGLVLIFVAFVATRPFLDISIATGAQGMLFGFLAIPIVADALVVWAVAMRNLPDGVRRASLAATAVVACGAWALVRTGGFTARDFRSDLHWRWTKTPEQRLVEKSSPPAAGAPAIRTAALQPVNQPSITAALPAETRISAKTAALKPVSVAALADTPAEWPGFRGAHRDDVISGVRINTDWSASPPVALWKREVGPGWSSFAVQGDYFFTQEQRGPEEIVACYRVSTGEPVWAHRDSARFWESNGGPGPRGTPTLSHGRVYTFGATGLLNVLNASDGSVVWSRNAAMDTGAKTPQWGFASSPLVVDQTVVVATAGQLIAYDRVTGAMRWSGLAHGMSYSSPQLATMHEVPQVLLLSEEGLTSVALADGKLLWEHAWKGYPIVQPALTQDGDVLISVSDSSGTRRLGVTESAGAWSVAERWTSKGLKPYFNDFVLHNGYAYGFDGSILACIDLKDGTRKWKGGRYGNGQLVLIEDQDLLLVLSEEGELALVRATPNQFTELARLSAIEGKTWNHPVLVRDVVLVRNGQEMAAFRLSRAGS